MEDGRISTIQLLLISLGHVVSACQKFLGTLYMRAHGVRNSNQIKNFAWWSDYLTLPYHPGKAFYRL